MDDLFPTEPGETRVSDIDNDETPDETIPNAGLLST
jgi:hypothetical protein